MTDLTLDKPTLARLTRRTLRNLAYLLISSFLGLFYFVILFFMIVVGLSLVIVWVGVPILLVTIGLWWVLARFDRNITNNLLDAGIPPMSRPAPVGKSTTRRFWEHLKNPLTWTSLIYLLLKFPFAALALGLSISALVWSIMFLVDALTSPIFQSGFYFVLSAVLLIVAVLAINALAGIWQLFARWSLTSPETRAAMQPAAGPALEHTLRELPEEPQPVTVQLTGDEPVEPPEPLASTIVDPVPDPEPISIPVNSHPEPVDSPIATAELQADFEPLTAREAEVLALLADGLSNREIAEAIFVTEGTIKRHTHNIYRKLDVSNRTQAVRRAAELNLLE